MMMIIIMGSKTSGFDTFIIDRLRGGNWSTKFQYFNSIGFRLSDQFTFLKFYVNCWNCSFTSTYYGNSFHAFVNIFSPDFIHLIHNSVNFMYDGKFMQQFSHSFYIFRISFKHVFIASMSSGWKFFSSFLFYFLHFWQRKKSSKEK